LVSWLRTFPAMRRLVLAIALFWIASCAPIGPYVWVDDYVEPAEIDPGEYHIAPGDLLSVRVYNQEAMSSRPRVRDDGRVSLPLLGDVQAAGLAPDAFAERIKQRLKEFLATPSVSVAVEETRILSVPVLGEVARPGQYPLERGAGVLDALAAAGGLTDYSHRDRIFVLRKLPNPARIRLTFEALSRGAGRASAFRLQRSDTIVVE
jgi:polysaccharide export outer membrane protein